MARVLIAGCGYVGAALGSLLVEQSHVVWGLRRSPRSLPAGIKPITADLAHRGDLSALPRNLDTVFYLVSPTGSEDALYRRAYVDGLRTLIAALYEGDQQPRILFASSTAVYGQRDGEWIDETSETAPEHWSGQRVLEGEQLVLQSPLPATVIRFGGIYGPRRTQLVDQVRTGQAVYAKGKPRYTNRIHRDDCAGVLQHLMRLKEPDPIYLGVDDEPAEQRAVLSWLAGALGAPEPRAADTPKAGRSGRSAGGGKRCRNARLLGSGYTFRYPTFREGYSAVLKEMI
jgi:nucleoside-diphosphate-sugar epimerase